MTTRVEHECVDWDGGACHGRTCPGCEALAAYQAGLSVRVAYSSHSQRPATPAMLEEIAGEFEHDLVRDETQFSDPQWERVDRLRHLASALRWMSNARKTSRIADKQLHEAISATLNEEAP